MKLPGDTRVAEAFSDNPSTAAAVRDVASSVAEKLGGNPDLVVTFFSPSHAEGSHLIREGLQRHLGPIDALVGCSSSSLIGGGAEHESGPGMSLWAARMPGTQVQAFDLKLTPREDQSYVRGWPDVGDEASVVLLAEPKSFPIDPFLSSLRRGGRFPTLIGGLVSSPPTPCLISNEVIKNSGAVGFVMAGAMRMEPVISQGCRPIGPMFRITRCKENVVLELDGEPAYERLESLVEDLPEDESKRFRKAPHVGLSIDTHQQEGVSNFLVRGIMGLDPSQGAVAVAEEVYDGMLLQFHARDGVAAHEDLESLLDLTSGYFTEPAGALLFDCMGRGPSLFGRRDHDIELVHQHWPDLPVSGFHASGEIGPLGGAPYIHGFTASMGLLVPNET